MDHLDLLRVSVKFAVLYEPQFFEFSNSDLEKVTRMMPTINVSLLKNKNISWHVIVFLKKYLTLCSILHLDHFPFIILSCFSVLEEKKVLGSC